MSTRSGSRQFSRNWSGAGFHSTRFFIPDHFYEVGPQQPAFKVLFNRMSPSANSRQHGSGIFHTLAYLEHLQLQGVRVINGAKSFRYEISKAAQTSLLKSLGLRFVPSRVIHSPHQAVAAAAGLRYPIIVKANIGGSGKGITRFNTKAELAAAAAAGQLDLGYDSVALVQEFIPARGGFITRVETLGGKHLYAIKVHLSGETFDLCPADICQTSTGQSLDNACVVEASKAGLKVEGFNAPADGDPGYRTHRAGRRHRRWRHRVHHRRPRRPQLLLRHQRALELRRRRTARGGLQPG